MISVDPRPEPVEGRKLRPTALLMIISIICGLLATTTAQASPSAPAASPGRLTNLAHLDFLMDEVRVAAVPGHDTYRLGSDRELVLPWTYADRNDDGSFRRVGGGDLDPATGDYSQGAFNTDDIARAAVVYLTDWRQTHRRSSRDRGYQLLRSVAYFQTTRGGNAGNSVLWMQPDGALNRSAKPVEEPDPSDSGPSYWQARTIWALGEGYAVFQRSDPAFAAFLRTRLRLAVSALNRDVLNSYGRYTVADGRRVPRWLIVNGADASAEAMLGLSSYVAAAPGDRQARRALSQLADGVKAMAPGSGAAGTEQWPYGAILPWAESRSMWHAWSSQMSAALARSSVTLRRSELLRPALREAVSFDTTLLTSTGAVNAWYPTPVDRTQIAYGVDSRLQSLLAVAEAAESTGGAPGVRALAGIGAGWYFGANAAGAPAYDPATGVTVDGIAPDGTINRNGGAESTIHGLLSMLALDAHPDVRARAEAVTTIGGRDGLCVAEAEQATTNGTVQKPADPWTGEAQYSNGSYLELARGQHAELGCGPSKQARTVEPVSLLDEHGRVSSAWTSGNRSLGSLQHRIGRQGITAASGALLPRTLPRRLLAGDGSVRVQSTRGTVKLDAVIFRPLLATGRYQGPDGQTVLLQATTGTAQTATAPAGVVRIYDARGRQIRQLRTPTGAEVRIPGHGFAVVTSG